VEDDRGDVVRTKLEIEIETAGSIASAMVQDLDKLERLIPPSKRGSNVQSCIDSLRMRISGMVDACNAATGEMK